MGFDIIEEVKKVQEASKVLAKLSSDQKNKILEDFASFLERDIKKIIEENNIDLDNAKRNNLSQAMVDRLMLDEKRVKAIASAVREIASLPDPCGKISNIQTRPSGIQVGKMSIPLGVIAMIYESRPNVTADAASLCFKAGNAVILRGGKEALHSNQVIGNCFKEALKQNKIHPSCVLIIPDPDREILNKLLTLNQFVDLIIPRGGEGLIKFVSENSKIPVIQHYKGVCHLYVDEDANLEQALNILINGKTQRTGVCNALESLLVHQSIADEFLKKAAKELEDRGVVSHVQKELMKYFKNATEASEEDYYNEYLALEISVKQVESIDDAISHIEKYGSGHTEVIVTKDYYKAQKFLKEVNSSVVMVNASSRFSDGGELGLGAEIGISTSKLHAYGPMGLESLTTEKFIIYGTGQVRS